MTELSVPSADVPRVKRLIRRTSLQAARALAKELMLLPTAAAVSARLEQTRKAEVQSNVRPACDAQ